ncbi:hypothetical protein [Streptomyces sp. NPDC059080]|uniref:hypothetical protein n=1 Tax=Streptomyces sp. NPDC059080 TaxID=3346718 RepID=UPI003677321D
MRSLLFTFCALLAVHAAGGTATAVPARATARPVASGTAAEMSGAQAVGLVLAGGAILIIAGQLLRLRLRIRRERQGGGTDDH